MLNTNNKGTQLNEKKVILPTTCNSCGKVLVPKQNHTYFDLSIPFANNSGGVSIHTCSSYCLNKKVAELSVDDTINGITIERLNLEAIK